MRTRDFWYKYMPQGSLTQHLFDLGENGCSPLTWKQSVRDIY